jgi:hypothetical protein
MRKATATLLLILGLSAAIPARAQFVPMPKPGEPITSNSHVPTNPEIYASDSSAKPLSQFRIGMPFAEFADKVELSEARTAEGMYNASEARKASKGKRGIITTPINGTNVTFLFDKGILKEVAVPSNARFDSGVEELSKTLGHPNVAKFNRAEWNTNGDTWVLISRQNGGIFLTVSSTADAVRLQH